MQIAVNESKQAVHARFTRQQEPWKEYGPNVGRINERTKSNTGKVASAKSNQHFTFACA